MTSWALALVLAATASGDLQLTAADNAIFSGSVEDAPPPARGGVSQLLAPVHYLASNEWQLEGFKQHIENVGGGYVGVGSDQAYLFIGWQQPEFAWLVDYDTAVVATHRVYAALFVAAPTPEAFVQMLHPSGAASAEAAIRAHFEPTRARKLAAFYRRNRKYLWLRIARLETELRRAGVASYLTDQKIYDAVRDRIVAGRVRPMLANLQDSAALRGIAGAAGQLGVPIRVVYLSNAEEYWDTYSPSFVDNLLALPIDASSQVLRTRVLAPVRDYEYFVGNLEAFRARLCEPGPVTARDALGPYQAPPQAGDRVVVLDR